MRQKIILIFCFLLAVMVFRPSLAQCENWKEYFQDSQSTYYYDKDSIHYPQTKKNILGITVQNKEIVNVWTREVRKKDGKTDDAQIEQIYCLEREYKGHRPPMGWDTRARVPEGEIDFSTMPDPFVNVKEVSKRRAPIEPGSLYEGLLKKVCP